MRFCCSFSVMLMSQFKPFKVINGLQKGSPNVRNNKHSVFNKCIQLKLKKENNNIDLDEQICWTEILFSHLQSCVTSVLAC